MSDVPSSSITYIFNGDTSATNLVNAAELDTQLGDLANTDNQLLNALDRITDSNNNLAPQTVGYPQLKAEVRGNLLPAQGGTLVTTAKIACRLVATSNVVSLSGNISIDGVTTSPGDRILLVAQTTASQNGIWVASAGAWSRATDLLAGTTQGDGWYTVVYAGTTNIGTAWAVTSPGTTVVGTGNMSFVQLAATSYANITQTVANISVLKSLVPPTYVVVYEVQGYYVAGDGGGGTFQWNPSDVTADNGGTVIIPNVGGTGRWNRINYTYFNARHFGAKGDNVNDDTTAIQAAITAAASRTLYIPSGIYKISATLLIVSEMIVIGDGVDEWQPSERGVRRKMVKGTTLLFSGTGTKDKVVYGVTDMSPSGGVRANPAAAEAYTVSSPTPQYALTNFYNSDSNPVTGAPATQRVFSAGLVVRDCSNVCLAGFRVQLNYNGVAGYVDPTLSGLGDNWDVGIWFDNTNNNIMHNVQSVGYWRIAAFLGTSIPVLATGWAQTTWESQHIERCVFQGFVGVLIRSGDTYACTAVTANTIEIPWHDSSPFPAAGQIREGGSYYTYTGISKAGDKLTFTGVTPNPVTGGVVVTSEIRASNGNLGTSGSVFEDCYISGLEHGSGVLAQNTLLGIGLPSKAIELSGEPCRAILFDKCSVLSCEDVLLHMHNARDIEFTDTYFEANNAATVLNGPKTAIPSGGRWIASPQIALSTAPYPSGETDNFQTNGCTATETTVDRMPRWERGPSTRYAATAGLFTPWRFRDGMGINRITSDRVIVRLFQGASFQIQDYLSAPWFDVSQIGVVTVYAQLVANVGELDLRSASVADLVRLRSGTTSVATFGPTTSTITSSASLRPGVDNGPSIGTLANRWSDSYAVRQRVGDGTAFWSSGLGTPEGVVTAPIGSLFSRLDGGATTTLYVKTSGAGNTGWTAK